MSAINSTGRTGASNSQAIFEGNRGSGQPVAGKSFSRERSEASSVDKMHPRLARFFGRKEPSAPNNSAANPYVRHQVAVNVSPSAPPAHLMPPEALQPAHYAPVLASAPPAHLMPQQALQPQHRNAVVPSAPPMELMPQQALQPQHRGFVLPSAPPMQLMPQQALQPVHRGFERQ